MTTRTVVSVDLAHSSYASNGVAVLTSDGDSIHAELTDVPLHGVPDPTWLAKFIAGIAAQKHARLIFLDGPQGWRDPTQDTAEMRACERKLAAPAKTGLPGSVKPKHYTAFVVFSIAVFDALQDLGWTRLADPASIENSEGRFAVESFPLAAWRTLKVPALPAKAKAKPPDVSDRFASLQQFVKIDASRAPSHDELQAIVGGLAGFPEHFAARVEGVEPRYLEGSWREGFIVSPRAKLELLAPETNTRLFTIRENQWYAWQMIPGYSVGGYFSPIYIGRFRALKTGKRFVEISFFNAGYADGVQGFFVKGRVLKRAEEFIVLDLAPNGQADRAAVISPISYGWMRRFTPNLVEQLEVDTRESVQDFLSRIYNIRP